MGIAELNEKLEKDIAQRELEGVDGEEVLTEDLTDWMNEDIEEMEYEDLALYDELVG